MREELKSWIGRKGVPITFWVERGKIREFAKSIKEDDPVYYDEAQGGIQLPITFLESCRLWDDGGGRPRPPLDLRRTLHGEQEYEFLLPIRPGDKLVAQMRIADIYEKPGKRGGTMTMVVTETEFTNERGQVVARARAVGIETGQVVKDN